MNKMTILLRISVGEASVFRILPHIYSLLSVVDGLSLVNLKCRRGLYWKARAAISNIRRGDNYHNNGSAEFFSGCVFIIYSFLSGILYTIQASFSHLMF